ncbi:MAG: CRISPR-associated endonuclease Cas1, partial [Planctomycetota bacterium]
MIKKTVEISRQPAYLSARLEQLVVQPIDGPKSAARSIPAEDIGVLLIDEPRCSITQGALETVLHHGGVTVICGRDHLPAGMLLPIGSHREQVQRLHDQIDLSKPRQKRLWQQIVRAKIKNQAAVHSSDAVRRKFNHLAREVRSGDTTNV